MNISMQREQLAAQHVRFAEDLSRVMEAILDSRFDVAEKICTSIKNRAESLGLSQVVELNDGFIQIIRAGDKWKAIHHFTNEYRGAMLQVITPMGFGISPI